MDLFTCDNVDINDSSLDGMNSFHATQVVAWQCGLWGYKTCKRRVPAIMEELIPAEIKEGMVEPKSTSRTQKLHQN